MSNKNMRLPFESEVMASRQHYDGKTYEPKLDQIRLSGQTKRVWQAMIKGFWWSLSSLGEYTGDPEGSISARIRDLRKTKFGSHTIERRREGDSGLFVYRLIPNPKVRMKFDE